MTPCPPDQMLARLLADSLSKAEQDALAQHVETCAPCQGKLDQMTGLSDTTILQRTEHLVSQSEAEEAAIQRLKRMRRSSASFPPDPTDPTVSRLAQSDVADQTPIDAEFPAVPGYEILGVLGRGGMGVVFKARQLALQRIVAIKMLHRTRAGEKELARFRTEADVIARLQHPNIVQIHDVSEVSGRPYFVMEYVTGGSLSEHLDGTPQSARLASQFVEVLARAVQLAHANGVIHRDLKPANILLVPAQGHRNVSVDGGALTAIPKIADFGVAKCISGDGEVQRPHSLTLTGDLLGTPSYMAPEQAAPVGPPVGPAADIYALGAILYELLTGRPPFKGERPLDTVMQLLHSEPVSVTDLQPYIPRDLDTICLKCLRKEPHHRYQSASDLADDLNSFLQGKQIKARPRGAVEKVWRWIRNHPATSGLVAAGVLTPILALVILSLLSAALVRSSALESAMQQAELLEQANNQYSLIVQRVEEAHYQVNKMVPPTPDTVPLSIPATFLHDVGERLHRDSKTGIQVRQYSDYPFPWRTSGGPHDDFEREALLRLRQSKGQETVHDFTDMEGEPVVRYAQARIMQQSCVDCHNTHPFSTRKDWKVGDVRGVLEIIRPLKSDEARVTQALQLAIIASALGSGLLLLGGVLAVWAMRPRIDGGS